jgi:selenocysteine lyase/cysteine desulfurase
VTVAGQATVESADLRASEVAQFDPVRARRDFPILQTEGFAFLDSAASTQKPQCVIDEISNCYSCDYANIHRGVYDLSARATANFEAVRATAQRFIGAAEAREIVFVREPSSFSNSSSISAPRSSIGATLRTAPFSSQSICQGTMFEWCSISVISTSSSGPTFWRP